jgi:hypothetical protein
MYSGNFPIYGDEILSSNEIKKTNMEINSEKYIFEHTGNYQEDVKHSEQSIEELKSQIHVRDGII